MVNDLQKADIWKRASAFLFDIIMTVIVAVGFIFLLAMITGTEKHYEQYEARMEYFEVQYGVDFDSVSDTESYEALPEAERELIDTAFAEFAKDDTALYHYNMLLQLIILNVSIGILLAFLILEFIVPLLFKNGQTLGKKIFGIGVMRLDGVKVNGQIMFIRAILGKYTVETMIPLMMLVWILIGRAGIMGLVIIALVLVGNLVMMIATRTNSPIHDMLANTVAVDMASQMIFDTPEAMLEYKQKLHAEMVEKAEYK